MFENKQWYLSKRFWINLVLMLIAVCGLAADLISSNDLLVGCKALLPTLATLGAFLNLALSTLQSQQTVDIPGISKLVQASLPIFKQVLAAVVTKKQPPVDPNPT